MSDNTTVHGVHARDLSSHELWEASLLRSRHRREIFHDVRKRRTRRTAGSIAASASMLGGTAAPAIAAAATGVGSATDTAQSSGLAGAVQGARLLTEGANGPTVASVQAKLRAVMPGIWVDGIYGPQTASAVRAFQRAHGLPVSGQVDATTWSALFRSGVTFLDGRTASQRAAEAKAPPTTQRFVMEPSTATAAATHSTPTVDRTAAPVTTPASDTSNTAPQTADLKVSRTSGDPQAPKPAAPRTAPAAPKARSAPAPAPAPLPPPRRSPTPAPAHAARAGSPSPLTGRSPACSASSARATSMPASTSRQAWARRSVPRSAARSTSPASSRATGTSCASSTPAGSPPATRTCRASPRASASTCTPAR